jgi:hypothetical protein
MVAAAAAAVAILFAGVVAVGLNTGGETTDVVADTATEAAEPAAAIESRSDLVLPEAEAASADEDAMADDAMDDEAMEDEEAAMDDAMDEAMADDAMDAMEEESMDSAADAGVAPEADAEAAFAAPLGDADESAADDANNAAQSRAVGFLGGFTTFEDLAAAATEDLAEVTASKTAADRSTFLPPTDCSDIAQELTGLNTATLLSTAFLDDNPVELHATADDQILILSSTDCSVIESIPGS